MALVRVKDNTTGAQYSIDETQVTDECTVLDKPAVDAFGRPLPPKTPHEWQDPRDDLDVEPDDDEDAPHEPQTDDADDDPYAA